MNSIEYGEATIADESPISTGYVAYIKYRGMVYVCYDFALGSDVNASELVGFDGLPLPLKTNERSIWTGIINASTGLGGRLVVDGNGRLRQYYMSSFKAGSYSGSFVYMAK